MDDYVVEKLFDSVFSYVCTSSNYNALLQQWQDAGRTSKTKPYDRTELRT